MPIPEHFFRHYRDGTGHPSSDNLLLVSRTSLARPGGNLAGVLQYETGMSETARVQR